jgi:hypothetical protein
MARAFRIAHRVRLAALLALGAFALHQVRYLAVFGGSSPAELARQGHGYMGDALAPLAVLSLAGLIATLIRGTEGAARVRTSLARSVGLFAATLLAVYVCQESLEGLLASGHPGGPAAFLADGGWVALPLALAIGLGCALLARALEGVEVAIARTHWPRGRRRARARSSRRPQGRPAATPISPLAFGLARRPPPAVPA